MGWQVTDVHEADVCKVIPTKFSGGKEVVPLQMRKLVSVLQVFDLVIVGSRGFGVLLVSIWLMI